MLYFSSAEHVSADTGELFYSEVCVVVVASVISVNLQPGAVCQQGQRGEASARPLRPAVMIGSLYDEQVLVPCVPYRDG
jgi:hypothetical protein